MVPLFGATLKSLFLPVVPSLWLRMLLQKVYACLYIVLTHRCDDANHWTVELW